MTCLAVMVPPLVVPSTRTCSPLVMALAEVFLVPFWYIVEDAWSTVTFRPADVDIVKLDLDTLPTVPDAPPEAGPDRALDAGGVPPAAFAMPVTPVLEFKLMVA
jgi:hypothetical protein